MSNTAIATLDEKEKAALIPASPDAVFGAPLMAPDSAAPTRASLSIPYVGFRGAKTKDETGALTRAGINVSDFYLMDVEPIRVKPFGIHILPGYSRFFTAVDNKFNITEVYMEEVKGDKAIQEHLFAVVAVAIPGEAGQPSSFVPARLDLRGSQAKALEKTLKRLPGANDLPTWTKLSAAHKVSGQVKFAGGRFRSYLSSSIEQSESTGNDYNLGHDSVSPTPEIDVNALNEWITRDWTRIQFVTTAHNIRVAELKKMVQ